VVAEVLTTAEGVLLIVASIFILTTAPTGSVAGEFGNGLHYLEGARLPIGLLSFALGAVLVCAGVRLPYHLAGSARVIKGVQASLLVIALYLVSVGFASWYTVALLGFAILLLISLTPNRA
jgi:hypothetical protein